MLDTSHTDGMSLSLISAKWEACRTLKLTHELNITFSPSKVDPYIQQTPI